MQPPTTAIRGSRNEAGNLLQLSAGFPLDGRCEVRSLRIVVANDDPAMMQFYREVLARLGHQVCVALTGRQIVDQCRLLRPDLAIIEVNVLVLDGIAAAYEICRDKPTPIILVSGNDGTDLLQRVLDNPYVLAWLFKPLKEADIGPAIVVAMSRFEQFESLRQEAADLRHVLEDRRLVERANGVIKIQLASQNSGCGIWVPEWDHWFTPPGGSSALTDHRGVRRRKRP